MSMKCPKCRKQAKIIDSRPGTGNVVTARRYMCLGRCEYRWSTLEFMAAKNKTGTNGLATPTERLIERQMRKSVAASLQEVLDKIVTPRKTKVR